MVKWLFSRANYLEIVLWFLLIEKRIGLWVNKIDVREKVIFNEVIDINSSHYVKILVNYAFLVKSQIHMIGLRSKIHILQKLSKMRPMLPIYSYYCWRYYVLQPHRYWEVLHCFLPRLICNKGFVEKFHSGMSMGKSQYCWN